MTLPVNHAPRPQSAGRQSSFPLQQQPSSLFLGWGPKI